MEDTKVTCEIDGCEVEGTKAGVKRHQIAKHGQDWRVNFPEDHQRTRSHRVLIPGGQSVVKMLAASVSASPSASEVTSLGGGWYLVNGTKVQGRTKAEALAG